MALTRPFDLARNAVPECIAERVRRDLAGIDPAAIKRRRGEATGQAAGTL